MRIIRGKAKLNKFGWVRDLPDQRDLKYKTTFIDSATLPKSYDGEKLFMPCYDQGELGSCTGNAVGSIIEQQMIEQKRATVFRPSRLFIYYNTRLEEGTIAEDTGAQLRTTIKVANKYGACDEITWQYNVSKFAAKPPKCAYEEASKNQALEYESVQQDLNHLKDAISKANPIAFGFMCYENLMSNTTASTGILGMPSKNMKASGGHAVVLVGYDDSKRMFKVRNSWGTSWGQKGYFWMPYEYVVNQDLADDFWIITLME